MSKKVNDENLLILQDEDGSEIKFEIVDIIEDGGESYAVLYPLTKGINEYVIVKYLGEDEYDEEMFEIFYELDIIEKIFETYKNNHPEIFK